MADSSWKPKRVSGGSTDSAAAAFKVELSIQSPEVKQVLEAIVAEREEFQVKDSKDNTPLRSSF